MHVESQNLRLHHLTVEEAQTILRRQKAADVDWAPGFPSIEHVAFLTAFIADATKHKDPGPFGLYLVIVKEASLVIGGAGFVGPPDENGSVEIVVELEPSERKHGYGSEAIAAIVGVARASGARVVTTAAPIANLAVQHAIEHGGLREVDRDEWIVYYAVDVRN